MDHASIKFQNISNTKLGEISKFIPYIDIAENRHGVIEKFPIMSLSIAVVTNEYRRFESTSQLVGYASKIKKKCKACWKSNYIIGDDK